MKFEILLSVMHQNDMNIAQKYCADADVLIINQCDRDGYDEKIYNGHKIRMISTTERGLSKSRNMAIKNATGDVCLICDDDVVYRKGYKDIILEAFENEKKADIIAFTVNHIHSRFKKRVNVKFRKAMPWKNYGSCCLAFKLKKVIENQVFFNTNFGAGSNKITQGEEAVWQQDARRKGLKLYQHPFCIADVEQSDSTWFSGYNEKYFYNLGAYLKEVYPYLKKSLKYYYVLRLNSVTDLSIKEQIKWLNNGMKGYKDELSYEEYIARYKKQIS